MKFLRGKTVHVVGLTIGTITSGALAIVVAFLAFAEVNSVTANGWVNAMVALVVLFLVTGGLTVLLAKGFRIRWIGRWGLAAGLVSAAMPIALVSFVYYTDHSRPRAGAASPQVIGALQENTYQLASVDPHSGFDDLEPLETILADRRIVALGEATHGTSEFFRMKHRLVELLVSELGFRHFAMEIELERVGPVLNDYIQGGNSEPSAALYWPWATTEYLALIEWMRRFNDGQPLHERIVFHGIDPQEGDRDSAMAANVASIVDRHDSAKVIVWAANSHVRGAKDAMGQHLKTRFGDEVYLVGFEFNEGAFSSRTKGVQVYRVGPFPPEYYSHALAQLPGSIRFLDFTSMQATPELRQWLAQERVTNHLFELYALTRYFRSAPRVRIPLSELFDGLVYIERSTPPTPLTKPRTARGQVGSRVGARKGDGQAAADRPVLAERHAAEEAQGVDGLGQRALAQLPLVDHMP